MPIPHEEKIKAILGEENYKTILYWCDNNNMNKKYLLELSSKLGEGKRVYGRLAQSMDDQMTTRNACREMFSYWYQMFPKDVSLEKLIKALKDDDVGLIALAYEIDESSALRPFAEFTQRPRHETTSDRCSLGSSEQISTLSCEEFMDHSGQVYEFNVAQHVSSAAKKLGKSWADNLVRKGTGERKGLLVSNTYADINNEKLDSLPGCDDSASAMKDALEGLQHQDGKTKILCTIKKDRSKDILMKDVEHFARGCNQDHVDTLVFYFAGHGGHEGLEICDDAVQGEAMVGEDGCETGNRYNLGTLASIKEGGNFIFGDLDNTRNCGKIFNHQLIYLICKATPNVSHRIIMFDCCRGDKSSEMSGTRVRELTVKYSDLQKMSNKEYKNTYVFYSTLPHQVAWCQKGGKGLTNFSKHFTEFLGHVDLSCMDVAINAALKHETKGQGHVQMVELIKWVDTPFQF